MAGSAKEPFFHQYETKSTIAEICSESSLVVYAGAGVTIDKSNLSWSAMVAKLLEPHVNTNILDLSTYIRDEGVLSAATTSYQLYRDVGRSFDDLAARERMASTLHHALYDPGTWQEGTLASTIAQFAYIWKETSDSGKNSARRICIATTNYDDYICQALTDTYSVRKRTHRLYSRYYDRLAKKRRKRLPRPRKPSRHVVEFPTDRDRLRHGDRAKLSGWVRHRGYPSKKRIACIYLHGRIPQTRSKSKNARLPVVSEWDYSATTTDTAATLISLFSKASVVFVGSSLTDGPLVEALVNTMHLDRRRWALMTRPVVDGNPNSPASVEKMRLTSRRLENLGVTPIYIDFHVQAPQFFRELTLCATLTDPRTYLSDRSGIRYGKRLAGWWSDWQQSTNEVGAVRRQKDSHEFLKRLLPTVRSSLGAPASEILKVEVWLRWKPLRHRKLRLWCNSLGTWSIMPAMVDADIPNDARFVSVEAFREGRPRYLSTDGSRWKSYVAMPLWDEGSSLLVGVVTLASMGWHDHDSLNPLRNSARISQTFGVLQYAGMLIAQADHEALRSELRLLPK